MQQPTQDEKLRARRVAEFFYTHGKDPTTELQEADPDFVSQNEFQPDAATEVCMFCRNKFTLINRRHHCRRCGFVLCGDCCPKTAETRLCLVCNYAVASSTGIDQTAADFLLMEQVSNYLRLPQHEPIIFGEILRVVTNLTQTDEVRQRISEEPLNAIIKQAYQYLVDLLSDKFTFVNPSIKTAEIKNTIGLFINLTASETKYFKQIQGLDFRFLSKFLIDAENTEVIKSVLWLFVNLSTSEKFAPLFLKYKETPVYCQKYIGNEEPKIYMRTLNLVVNLINFDETAAEKFLTRDLGKALAKNIQQNDALLCYTSLRAFCAFLTHDTTFTFVFALKKFNILDFVETLLSKTKSQLGLLSLYTFYTNMIKFAPPEEVQRIIKKEVIQVVFNSEHKFDEQSKNLKLLFKTSSEYLIQFLADNVKVVKFLCKNYRDKDIQGCLKYLNSEDTALLFKQQQDQLVADVEDDETDRKKKKSKKLDSDDEDEPAPKKKSKKIEDDDEDEDDDVPKPKRKSKKEDDDEEDEDSEPKPKRKSRKVEEDDDEDIPKTKKSKKSKKVVEDDDDDE